MDTKEKTKVNKSSGSFAYDPYAGKGNATTETAAECEKPANHNGEKLPVLIFLEAISDKQRLKTITAHILSALQSIFRSGMVDVILFTYNRYTNVALPLDSLEAHVEYLNNNKNKLEIPRVCPTAFTIVMKSVISYVDWCRDYYRNNNISICKPLVIMASTGIDECPDNEDYSAWSAREFSRLNEQYIGNNIQAIPEKEMLVIKLNLGDGESYSKPFNNLGSLYQALSVTPARSELWERNIRAYIDQYAEEFYQECRQ